ncbi:hypothetical protein MASR1M32_12230 [Rhodobacter sp.]
MTDLIHVTVTVPLPYLADAGQLARVLGYSEADAMTFDLAPRVTVAGQTCARAAGLVTAGWLLPVYAPLVEPEWGADMPAARRAQALLLIQDQRGLADPSEVAPDPARITVVVAG